MNDPVSRGKSAFETLIAQAIPLSEFLLRELAAAHPPTTAEGQAALVSAARPLLAELRAPVLSALLRRQLTDLTGLPEADLRALLHVPGGSPWASAASTNHIEGRSRRLAPPSSRPHPSLVRELIQALLLQPESARRIALPQPDDGTSEGNALAALVQFCSAATGPLTTPGVIQHFVATPHEPILAAALATAHDHGVTLEQADEHLRAGMKRYWLQAKRSGLTTTDSGAQSEAAGLQEISQEEVERLRQLEIVRRALPEAPGVSTNPRPRAAGS